MITKGGPKVFERRAMQQILNIQKKLISLIERFKLYKFDKKSKNKRSKKKRSSKIISKNHMVQKGDTLYSISKLYNTTVDKIKKENNLNSTELIIGQQLKISTN
jgi:LysM repeat protein